jgi:hypothetical protein
MVRESVTKALEDAKLKFTDVQQAVVAYVDGILLFLLRKIQFN